MKTVQELHEYWCNPDNENKPEGYAKPIERSEYLLNLIKKYAKPDDEILELGCNIGRNLHCLYNAGFKNLSGVEISASAIEQMMVLYPELANLSVYNDAIENIIKELEDSRYGIVFAMAVLSSSDIYLSLYRVSITLMCGCLFFISSFSRLAIARTTFFSFILL